MKDKEGDDHAPAVNVGFNTVLLNGTALRHVVSVGLLAIVTFLRLCRRLCTRFLFSGRSWSFRIPVPAARVCPIEPFLLDDREGFALS